MTVTKIGSEILVNTATASDQSYPQITALVGGGFVVTWEDHSAGVGGATGDTSSAAVKAQVFDASGAAVGSEILVNTATTNYQGTAQIAALPDGGFVVTWEDYSQGLVARRGIPAATAVKAQVFDDSGATVGSEILVNTATTSTQASPRIMALAEGGFVVTWQDFEPRRWRRDGRCQQLTPSRPRSSMRAALTVGTEILVNTATVSIQSGPEITALADGGFVVTWNDYSQGIGGATGDDAATSPPSRPNSSMTMARRRLRDPRQHRNGRPSE